MNSKNLLKIGGKDFYFENIKLHNPTLNEIIEYIENENDILFSIKFLSSSFLEMLDISKENIEKEINDFEIFINLIFQETVLDQEILTLEQKKNIINLLALIFKDFSLSLGQSEMIFENKNDNILIILNNENFNNFQEVIKEMFDISFLFGENGEKQYNIVENSKQAQAILEKLKKAEQKRNRINGNENNGSIFENYVLILSVGLKQSPKTILDLTLYQVLQLFKRFKMKLEWDLDIKCRLAGGSPDNQPDNWLAII